MAFLKYNPHILYSLFKYTSSSFNIFPELQQLVYIFRAFLPSLRKCPSKEQLMPYPLFLLTLVNHWFMFEF